MNSICDVLARASYGLSVLEANEQRAAEAQRANRVEEADGNRMQALHDEHVSRVMTGHTPAELERQRQDAEAYRTEPIAELEAELDRLAPGRRAAASRAQAEPRTAETLRRAKAVKASPTVQRMIDQFDRDEEIRRNERVQAQIRALEASGYRPPDEHAGPMIWR